MEDQMDMDDMAYGMEDDMQEGDGQEMMEYGDMQDEYDQEQMGEGQMMEMDGMGYDDEEVSYSFVYNNLFQNRAKVNP